MRVSVRFLVSAFILTATACGSSTGTTYGGGSTPPASCAGTGASATIDATASLTFSPASPPAIMAAQKVCWVNNSGIAHTVTSDNAAFTSGNLPNGSTVVVTFPTAGSYPYHCSIHPATMTGTITVQ